MTATSLSTTIKQKELIGVLTEVESKEAEKEIMSREAKNNSTMNVKRASKNPKPYLLKTELNIHQKIRVRGINATKTTVVVAVEKVPIGKRQTKKMTRTLSLIASSNQHALTKTITPTRSAIIILRTPTLTQRTLLIRNSRKLTTKEAVMATRREVKTRIMVTALKAK